MWRGRSLKLANWNERCTFKAANDDWATTLATRRQAESDAFKESNAAAARLKKAQQSPRQCSATLSQGRKGVRCSKDAVQQGLCRTHLEMARR